MDTEVKNTFFPKRRNFIYLLLVSVVFIAGFIMRYQNISDRGLEYDEIWTAQHYSSNTVSNIFTDTATPNNHPLHSFLVKLSFSIFGPDKLSLRLPAFMSGVGLMPLVFFLAWLIFRQRSAALLALSFTAFNGMLIHYSQTARGYSVQTFLISLFILSIIYFEKNRKNIRNFKWFYAGIFVIPGLAILTLPTSIIFLLPLIAAHCFYLLMNETDSAPGFLSGISRMLSKNRGIITSYLLLGCFSMAWYLINLDKYSAGQSFGSRINSMKTLYDFLHDAFIGASGWYFFAGSFLIITRKKYRKHLICWLLLLSSVIVFGLIFKGGPPRVYTPLVPVAMLLCAGGIGTLLLYIGQKTKLKYPGPGLIIILCFLSFIYGREQLSYLTPTDWSKAVPIITAKYPKNYYMNYPAGDGYAVKFNNYPNIMTDNYQRMSAGNDRYIVQVGRGKNLNGLDLENGNEVNIPLGPNITPFLEKTAGLECCVSRLEAITQTTRPDDIKSHIVVTEIGPAVTNLVSSFKNAIYSYYKAKQLLIFNPWFWDVFKSQAENDNYCGSMLCTANCPYSLEEILKMQKNSNGAVRFYMVKSFSRKD